MSCAPIIGTLLEVAPILCSPAGNTTFVRNKWRKHLYSADEADHPARNSRELTFTNASDQCDQKSNLLERPNAPSQSARMIFWFNSREVLFDTLPLVIGQLAETQLVKLAALICLEVSRP